MADLVSNLAGRLNEPELSEPLQAASRKLTALVEDSAYVGEVYSLGYDEALVQIHDFHRQRVGGIPALSFLIATRVSMRMKPYESAWRRPSVSAAKLIATGMTEP